MSTFAVIIYEILYFIIFFGLILSQSTTIYQYFPHATLGMRIVAMIILFNGFFVPYYLKLLRIKLSGKHYLLILVMCCFTYIIGSNYFYLKTIKNKRFHSVLHPPPSPQNAIIPKPKDVYRIICLGGSTTEGNRTSNYPEILQKMLNEKYPDKKIEVINAGKYYYNTEQLIIEYLFWLKETEPDLIIVCEAIADVFSSFTMPPFAQSPYRKDYGHFYGPLGTVRYPKLFEEFVGSFLFADLRQPKLEAIYFNDFKSQHAFRRNLETLIEITQSEGIKLILSNQAHCYSPNNDSDKDVLCLNKSFLINEKQYADERSYYDAMELFNGIIKETAEKFSIPFVDQYPTFRGKRKVFTDSVHMTDKGHELKAKLFLNKIVELGLIR